MNPQKIIIFGLRGSGKTTLAKMTAEYLNTPHADLDELITARSGEDISHIVAKYGWEEFRKREHQMLTDFLDSWTGGVLSLGGGCPAFENNRILLSRSGAKLIYLDIPCKEQIKRVEQDETNRDNRPSLCMRPSIKEDILDERLSEYHKTRSDRIGEYLQLADVIIENTSTLREAIEKIIHEVQKGNICVSLLAEQSPEEHDTIFSDPRIKCIEWRADSLTHCPSDFTSSKKQKIITLRTHEEGGHWGGNNKEYFTTLKTYDTLGADFLDVEYSKIDQIFAPMARELSIGRWGNKNNKWGDKFFVTPLILSYHNHSEMPSNETLTEILLGMIRYEPSIIKIACKLTSPDDKKHLYKIRTWFREKFPKQETIFIGMGELGSDLRGIFGRDGDRYTFASVGISSAPGQMNVQKTHHTIHGYAPYTLARESWESDTRENLKKSTIELEKKSYQSIFLGGAQIRGSLSPEIHNSWSQSENLDFEYILCNLENGLWGSMHPEEALEILSKIPEVIGGNITMPYKIQAYEYFKQKNQLDEVGLLAGSVNTYFRGNNGTFYATSSDVDGFVEPVKTLEPHPEIFHLVILGSGGAARAILAGAYLLGVQKVTIINRSEESFDELRRHFDGKIVCHHIALYDEKEILKTLSGEKYILVNTLPFGFKKELPSFPLKTEMLEQIADKCHIYFDIVYDRNEGMTPTSAWFQKNAPQTHLIHGRDMLIAQAKKGYQLWKNTIFTKV